ncbi:intra-flagellar transport protein 57-domain-containing protein [Catenaria anguillulae PL171]|uniref:Intra-flagellar transport protein 57-domain-containing protein n=1 Tax=Catenaria anguillulae PL171 TaxID=765915 RepID=A0A1Y2HZF9_9FUNG|nr:intra-flagellar transport protein 57-domain-containing protein [Catenaria anguillulae PL171]
MDALLDRLRLLNYSTRFCAAKKMKPMDPDLFVQPHATNPTYQLNYFYTLLAWLVSLASTLDGISFQAPSELDDPNVTANNAAAVLKTAGIPPPSTEADWNPSKLRQGYGESVLAALTGMADRALKGSGFAFKKPVFDKNEQFEEAQTDDAAEIGNPGTSTDTDDIPEDETLFGGHGGGLADVDQDQPHLDADADTNVDSVLSGIFRKSAIASSMSPASPQRPATAAARSMPRLAMIKGRSQTNLGAGGASNDPEAWRAEVERVTPRLKVHLKDDHKQWRVHVSAMGEYRALIANEWGWGEGSGSTSTSPSTSSQASGVGGKAIVTRLLTDLDSTLEKLRSRESYVNTQLDALVDAYREVQSRLGALRLEYNTGSEKMGALAQDLQRVGYELDQVKSLMDDLGSGMTDSKPLLNIKSTLQRLKAELKQMEVRRGVLEHQLMSGRIRHKTRQVVASSGAAGRTAGGGGVGFGGPQRKGSRQQQAEEPFAFMFMGSPEMAI